MLVRDIMSSPAISVRPDTPVPEVGRLMQARDIGSVAVTDASGVLVGIITESDFTGLARCVPFSLDLAPVIFGARAGTWEELRRIYDHAKELRARDIMTDRPQTAREDEEVGAVVHEMLRHNRKHVPVVRDGVLVGMLARHDLLKLLVTPAKP